MDDLEVIQSLADLPQGLKYMGSGALGGTIEALADGVVVGLVNLSHGKGDTLLKGSVATRRSIRALAWFAMASPSGQDGLCSEAPTATAAMA